MAIDIVTEDKTETKPVLSARELPPTFSLQIRRVSSHYEGTISNNRSFEAMLYYTSMHRSDEIPHTADQRTYDFLLWSDSYAQIGYQGKMYILDPHFAEEIIG